jgi:hypothetical protein
MMRVQSLDQEPSGKRAALHGRLWAAVVCLFLAPALPALAQSYASNPFDERPVGTVTVTIANPSADEALNSRVADAVRRSLALFPGSTFSRNRADAAIGVARRNPAIEPGVCRAAGPPFGGKLPDRAGIDAELL